MKITPTLIKDEQLSQISGGNLGILFLLELPHIIMGIREFTNYTVDLYQEGCQEVDDKDHFTHCFCNLIS